MHLDDDEVNAASPPTAMPHQGSRQDRTQPVALASSTSKACYFQVRLIFDDQLIKEITSCGRLAASLNLAFSITQLSRDLPEILARNAQEATRT